MSLKLPSGDEPQEYHFTFKKAERTDRKPLKSSLKKAASPQVPNVAEVAQKSLADSSAATTKPQATHPLKIVISPTDSTPKKISIFASLLAFFFPEPHPLIKNLKEILQNPIKHTPDGQLADTFVQQQVKATIESLRDDPVALKSLKKLLNNKNMNTYNAEIDKTMANAIKSQQMIKKLEQLGVIDQHPAITQPTKFSQMYLSQLNRLWTECNALEGPLPAKLIAAKAKIESTYKEKSAELFKSISELPSSKTHAEDCQSTNAANLEYTLQAAEILQNDNAGLTLLQAAIQQNRNAFVLTSEHKDPKHSFKLLNGTIERYKEQNTSPTELKKNQNTAKLRFAYFLKKPKTYKIAGKNTNYEEYHSSVKAQKDPTNALQPPAEIAALVLEDLKDDLDLHSQKLSKNFGHFLKKIFKGETTTPKYAVLAFEETIAELITRIKEESSLSLTEITAFLKKNLLESVVKNNTDEVDAEEFLKRFVTIDGDGILRRVNRQKPDSDLSLRPGIVSSPEVQAFAKNCVAHNWQEGEARTLEFQIIKPNYLEDLEKNLNIYVDSPAFQSTLKAFAAQIRAEPDQF